MPGTTRHAAHALDSMRPAAAMLGAPVLLAVLLLAVLLLAAPHAAAQEGYRPAPENLEARRWFQDAKFGLFIHWGVYSTLGAGEWVMQNRQIRVDEYARLPAFFNPVDYDPAQWVALAKAAGMKYITVTTRHHDGFAMFDSKASDYNIVKRTPYGRDAIRMLVDAARKEGIKVFFYYSQLDWHHPDYYPRGQTGRETGRPDGGNFARYVDYMNAQLRELLTNYGPVGGVWFDGEWDQPKADWRLGETYRLIHELQPQALIGSNHHTPPHPGEDFQMFEKDLPGQHTTGFNPEQTVSALPLEMCETISGAWGFNITDRDYKSTATLVRTLVNAAGRNANFLLNVGPMPNGRIQPEFVTRLREVGRWMDTYGRSIYGTRGGPIEPQPWGVTTQRGDTVYVHVLDWRAPSLALPPLSRRVKSARLLRDGSRVETAQNDFGLLLKLPRVPGGVIDEVVELQLGD
jgi:alpha-L-fucosidase